MEPDEVFNNPALYEYDQVLTQEDLADAVEELAVEYNTIPPEFALEKAELRGALVTLDAMLKWLQAGKPDNFGEME